MSHLRHPQKPRWHLTALQDRPQTTTARPNASSTPDPCKGCKIKCLLLITKFGGNLLHSIVIRTFFPWVTDCNLKKMWVGVHFFQRWMRWNSLYFIIYGTGRLNPSARQAFCLWATSLAPNSLYFQKTSDISHISDKTFKKYNDYKR
jgi:hypothetical protein